MAAPNLKSIGDDRCENLRWKGLFIDAAPNPDIPEGEPAYWCLTTQICLGPDSKLVDHYECNPARKCYKPL
jgi:hypothetical protein